MTTPPRELSAILPSDQPTNIRRRLAIAWGAMKAFPVLASGIKILEWVKGLISNN